MKSFSNFFALCCRRGNETSEVDDDNKIPSNNIHSIKNIEDDAKYGLNSKISDDNDKFLLPRKFDALPTLVLDLDLTLVYSTLEYTKNCDFYIQCFDNDEIIYIFVKLRPYLDSFLEKLSKLYEIVVFTAAKREYAVKVIEKINADGYIKHALYRDSCKKIENDYVKDLSVLGRDLSKTWIVDDNENSFRLQPENGLLIEAFYGDDNDVSLYNLLQILENKYLG